MSEKSSTVSALHRFVCVYGHFYQPPREDPFTGRVPRETGADPFENFNEKITAECYRPNLAEGNFERISFDLGPTLAAWLERAHPDVLAGIVAADRRAVERFGAGGALAQAYNHTILPLASSRDKRTQILWGLRDFRQRFGRDAEGMWLAETAVDLETLDILAEQGVRYTVLAPWQAAEPVDCTEPYRVELPSGRSITVFFYNGPLSGAVSFNDSVTANADTFAHHSLPPQFNAAKTARGEDQFVVIATDGELYGHHKQWRDRFLERLTTGAATAAGFGVTNLGRYLRDHPATRTARLHLPSAWSCAHGVARWGAGCGCVEGDSAWKPALRAAFDRLAMRIDTAFIHATEGALSDPWAARDGYLERRNGWVSERDFWTRYGRNGGRLLSLAARRRVERLLEAEYFGQWMYTSCGWFFEDLDRIEPRNDIAFARRAIALVWQATGVNLEPGFVRDLAAAQSWRTGRTGADLYASLPPVARGLAPEPAPRVLADLAEDVA